MDILYQSSGQVTLIYTRFRARYVLGAGPEFKVARNRAASRLATALGFDDVPLGDPAFDEAYATIISECQKAGVMPGCHATGSLVQKRFGQGMRMVTAIADQLALAAGAKADLARARGEDTSGGSGSLY